MIGAIRTLSLRTILFVSALGSMAFAHEGYAKRVDEGRSQKLSELSEIATRLDAVRANQKREDQPVHTAQPQNGIDTLTFARMTQLGVPINELCDDGTFIRRVSLVLTGRLPEPELTRRFLANDAADKRSAAIDELLASEAFTDHWSFWLQEYFASTTRVLRAGVLPYSQYFDEVVASQKPLTEMAREMLTATGLTEEVAATNYTIRSTEMARLPLDQYDNLAAKTTEKFLGIQTECISCHDGANHLENINLFLAEKKREDLWSMASFFSGLRLRPGRVENNQLRSYRVLENASQGYVAESDAGDRPLRTGGTFQPKYLFDGSGVEGDANWRQTLADKVTADRQFARNFANRFWGHAFGLGIVEPMDGFDPIRIDPTATLPEGWDRQADNLELLEHLTDQMISSGYNFRTYLRYLLNSATFQLSSEFRVGSWKESYATYFARYPAHRLSAEAIYDSIQVATGVVQTMVQQTREISGLTAEYAHQLIDPNLPRGNRYTAITRFLSTFGRGNRFDISRNATGGIAQALLLMNSSVVDDRLLANGSRLNQYLSNNLSDTQIVKELYLDVLCREPSETEIGELLAEMNLYESQRERAATVMWLLLNKAEFTFVY